MEKIFGQNFYNSMMKWCQPRLAMDTLDSMMPINLNNSICGRMGKDGKGKLGLEPCKWAFKPCLHWQNQRDNARNSLGGVSTKVAKARTYSGVVTDVFAKITSPM